ncbi:MAG: hypothetical protein AAGA89_08455, partial [Pseudomonadota bacterium]
MYIRAGVAVVTGTTFESNTAFYGGATYGNGGAIAILSGSLSLMGSELLNNVSGYHGGGLHSSGSAVVTVDGTTFEGNSAMFNGGALALRGGTADLLRVELLGNEANQGAGIYSNAVVTLVEGLVEDNTAIVGGGVYHATAEVAASMNIRDSSFLDNVGSGGTGGIHNAGCETYLLLEDSVVFRNKSFGSIFAGGITNEGNAHGAPTMDLVRANVSLNQSTANGGGILNSDGNL